MMNFKKNQNNAVCSMDCKNCPNGASQPNPMDDSMFEKSIAMLHNWVMLEAIREDHPKERIVMVILPGAGGELLTEAGSRDIFEDVYDEMEADLVADGELLLHYDKSDVIETDRTRYLLGAAEVSEIDQNGNEFGTGEHSFSADVPGRYLPCDGQLLHQNHPVSGYQLSAGTTGGSDSYL